MTIWNGENENGVRSDPNTFLAKDARGNSIGEASVTESTRSVLFPNRPHCLQVRVSGDTSCRDALLGAATARAMMLAMATPRVPARIYAECDLDDTEKMALLNTLGYRDDDSVVRMWRPLSSGPLIKPMPRGCTVVKDALEDETERRYFLERYNAVFATAHSMHWMDDVCAMDGFTRLLLVNASGLVSEMILWNDGGTGVVGAIQTAPESMRQGAASYLMELAREHWIRNGIKEARFDVWLRLEAAQRLAATSGYRTMETLIKYPGINIG